MTDEPPSIDWDAVRLRYEGRDETVTVIAASIGMDQPELSRQAKRRGWTMRKPQQVKGASTSATIRRLKDSFQQRLHQFEGAASEKDDIRDTSTLLRSFERVLDLEQRHRKRKTRSQRETRRLNDAQRHELARRIVGLLANGGC